MLKTKLWRQEEGFASIVVALVLIVVLALMTVGFAQLARREQQGALDKQLADQAYYAAESGINDAKKNLPAIQAAQAAGNLSPTTCIDSSILPNKNINPNDVSYTCVLANLTPPELHFGGLSPRTSRSIAFSTTGALDSLTVRWGSDDGHYAYPATASNATGDFSNQTDWNTNRYPAVVQFSITPLNDLSSDSLVAGTYTAYLYPARNRTIIGDSCPPSSTTSCVSYDTGKNGPIVSGNCSGASGYTCSATISGLSGAAGDYYLVHMLNYYDATDLLISDAKAADTTPLKFVDGQVELDSTGRAKNVLKRLNVFQQLHPIGLPVQALESQGTCKRFQTTPILPATNRSETAPDGQLASCDLWNSN